MGVMEGHSMESIKLKYVNLFPPAIRANWTVWPIIQFVNFRFMPLPYRVPFQATCGVFWTLYLSLLNSSKTTQAAESKADLEKSAKVAGKKITEAAAVSQ
jgi:protein Mpv17